MELKPTKIPLPRYTGMDKTRFLQEIYPLRKPAVLQDLDLGVCKSQWTLDYMSRKGGGREVKIHVSELPQLDFIKKNFLYRSLPFDVFVRRAAEDKHTDFFISEVVITFSGGLQRSTCKESPLQSYFC
ncbi:unnamed protein product [Staurois parvus]|uniref:Uncharacterized protein n=1 Tax=Staurois parvus TaxID=386267 RepID=A0ABN9CFL7_9NEOB|nr:unnamed protein product [Staurois parvus]